LDSPSGRVTAECPPSLRPGYCFFTAHWIGFPHNWTGFYIGGHVGGAWTNEQWVNTADTALFGDLSPGQGFGQRGAGVLGGGQIGYNWQASNFVFGLEGTVSGLDNHGRGSPELQVLIGRQV
jgi:opacity protein-like surface antigen